VEWGIVYYKDEDGNVPAEDFLDSCPPRVEACRLENGTPEVLSERGFNGPQIAVINGMSKRNATVFSEREYKTGVRELGDDYLANVPRPIAE
jgi:hypothetical protein